VEWPRPPMGNRTELGPGSSRSRSRQLPTLIAFQRPTDPQNTSLTGLCTFLFQKLSLQWAASVHLCRRSIYLLLFVVDGLSARLSFGPVVQNEKSHCADDYCYEDINQSWAATFPGKHETVGCGFPAAVCQEDDSCIGQTAAKNEFLPHCPTKPRASTGFSLLN
jgi:hypothetical protein